MRHYTLYNIYKVTLLTIGLLTGMAGDAWGQEYTIKLKNDIRQDIPEKVDTIYIPAGKTRDLFVPELKINDGVTVQYRWFVNWYRTQKDGTIINIDRKFATTPTVIAESSLEEGGNAHKGTHTGALKQAKYKNAESLFWYFRLFDGTKTTNEVYPSTATGASTVKYSMPESIDLEYEDFVICDVSPYIDGLENSGNLTEPTLTKRYKFVIKNAQKIVNQIENDYLEKYEIDAPANAEGVSVQMKTFPSNYCWKSGSGNILVGNKFRYTINGTSVDLNPDKKVILIGTLKDDTKVEVCCVAEDNSVSGIIAEFNIKV
ncbi:hypothetical protein [Parabacteroides sp.]